MEFIAFFFSAHIDFNTYITDDETVFLISKNFDNWYNTLIDIAKDTGAEYDITENYLYIKTKETYEIIRLFSKTLGL